MKTRRLLAVLLFFLFAFVSVHQAIAGNVIDRILKKGVLTMGTTGHYPPFTVKDKSGKHMGFDIDVATMMAEAMGVKLEIKEIPITDIFKSIDNGSIDMAMSGITITPARNLRVAFIGPYFVTGQSILGHKGLVDHVKGPEDINKPSFRLAVANGTTGAQVAKILAPKADIMYVKNMDAAFKAVINNKADAMFADEPYCVVTAFRNKDKKLAVSEPFTFEPLGVAMPQTDLLWLNWVDNFLMNLNATGKLKELKAYWLANPDWMQRLKNPNELSPKNRDM